MLSDHVPLEDASVSLARPPPPATSQCLYRTDRLQHTVWLSQAAPWVGPRTWRTPPGAAPRKPQVPAALRGGTLDAERV